MSQTLIDTSTRTIGQTTATRTRHLRRGAAVSGLLKTLNGWIARRRQRKALGAAAERNDYLLVDIGVSRAEALRQAAKPFWRH